ncbi:MAG: hypothetical protein M1G31_13695 [Pseudanabaena sp. Salubria-1]|jgi:hypothetical protein|nr:hypothetical protein [Pseudanabaena sp. Salubria-1]
MLAEEFQTTVSNGKIQIPDSMRTEFEGCEVRVIVLKDNRKKKALNTNLRNLFKTTQALPQVQAISEAEIIAEIAAYRKNYLSKNH